MSTTIVECAVCGKKNRVPASASGVPRCGNCHSPLSWIADADDATFTAVVEQSVLPVLVDIWAPWCGPCRTVTPVLERLAREYAGRVKLVKVNADEAPRVSERFAVRAIPTLMVMRRDQLMSRQTGALPEQQLRAWLDSALPPTGAPPEPDR